MPLPWLIAFLVIIEASFGSIALLLELLTRFTAVSLALIMMGPIVTTHLPHGIFMN